jgi:hypothetical protein
VVEEEIVLVPYGPLASVETPLVARILGGPLLPLQTICRQAGAA